MKKNKLILNASALLIVVSLIYIFPVFRTIPTGKNVSIIFYPLGVPDCCITIYNNDDSDFSQHIVNKITKARKYLFYIPCKEVLQEGFYKIFIEDQNQKYEYEINTDDCVYDVYKDRYLRITLLEDIYLFLAMQKLDEIVRNENNSEGYVRFFLEKPFNYLNK